MVTLKMMLAVMCPPVATMTVLVVVVVVLILMVVATLLLWRNTTLCLSVNRPLGEATCNTVRNQQVSQLNRTQSLPLLSALLIL